MGINTNTAFADDSPVDRGLAEVPKADPSPNPVMFTPIGGVCKCTSLQVKTVAILMFEVSAVCYYTLCSKDKTLLVACNSLAGYTILKLIE